MNTVDFTALDRATREIRPPFAVLDLRALHHNAESMRRRAGGKPIRVASKSVRCRSVLRSMLALPGYAGILAFTLPEALWLAGEFDDVLVGYPTADDDALHRLAADPVLAARVTVMADCPAHLDRIAAAAEAGGHPLRVCLDLDASLTALGGRLHFGTHRSPLHTPAQARDLAHAVVARSGLRLVGVMAYEAQIAGVGDNAPGAPLRRAAIRTLQGVSRRELRLRREAVVAAVREVAPLEFVNGGGTGSLESTAAEAAVTELGAGSGLYAPTLFDTYRGFRPRPAAFFVQSVVRRPSAARATVLGGGWPASGAAGRDRLPTPVWPPGLRLTRLEGAGEVQTPLTGPGVAGLVVGDRVWFRHTKAGELCERVDALHLVDGDRVVDVLPTYRGEGRALL
ncbi:amino acid deaminase/aldolase [Streptomyces sp. KAI-26]|uniref:amino acid deaminase/aldolase n=1 Tax=unclassified Streptomyces TaxID=2593676 RepID=UPI001587F1EC|nr:MULTISPECIES: amino acid deaminase/aldolase [unclassified Streptomyces]NUV82491.1 amino acid deaminase/aldolase [Streptomyces sp. CAI-155]NUV88322.1 amino acid deaminase/aldolase [Streptomyces sp. KAI-26]NUW22767.1 amino acid deaminase/aldolase [Streptomyces roseoviolaceus]